MICACRPTTAPTTPSVDVTPDSLDFGPAKVGATLEATLSVVARTRAEVVVSEVRLEGADRAAFTVTPTAVTVPPLGSEPLSVGFTPSGAREHTATLVIVSDDPDAPTTRVPLVGEGRTPVLAVVPRCEASAQCVGSATLAPPGLDFGAEPLNRATPLPASRLPLVQLASEGEVPLRVPSARVEGPDAAAFQVEGGLPDGGWTLAPGTAVNLPVRFRPTSAGQASYQARLVVTSDDPQEATAEVALTGRLAVDLPPTVCANVTRVVPPVQVGPPRAYDLPSDWAPLLTPPPAGYDFRLTRDIRPGDLVVVSALSDASPSTCTTDPEGGRTGLVYAWRLVDVPPGAQTLSLGGAATAQAQLRPILTGEYRLELTVTDGSGQSTTVAMRLAVAVKQDLVVQLRWPNFTDVDLDVHLVRPSSAGPAPFSGVFSPFTGGVASTTSGDINGYAVRVRASAPGAGLDFDWGEPGAADDPTLNLDDTGTAGLVENVSLNFPENDPACATSACDYKVLVHVFRDARSTSVAEGCVVDGGVGCRDGEPCSCAPGFRCVASEAPIGAPPLGSGKCYEAPAPTVAVFLRGDTAPAAIIPTPPAQVLLGAPCTMWYAADVRWPARSDIGSLPDGGTPPPVVIPTLDAGQPVLARFGYRQAGGSLQCSPDTVVGTTDWYSLQP